MSSFRSYQKEMKKKHEQDKVLKSLQKVENEFAKRKEDYAKKAKDALKEGNKSQYMAYVSLLKNAMFNLAQAQDMTANFIIARDLREMATTNKDFVNAINKVMKDVYKISKSVNVAASRKIYDKALNKQSYTATQLKQLLEDNNVSFQSSVNDLSDITDSEIKSVLEEQIKREERDFAADIEKLEAEFSVLSKKPQHVRGIATVDGAQSAPVQTPHYESAPAPVKKTNEVKTFNETKNLGANSDNESHICGTKQGATSFNKSQNEYLGGSAPSSKNSRIEVKGIAFRPQHLDDYMGQLNAVETLKPAIKMAKLCTSPLPHILLCGSYGQGKTTLANIIANEMGGNFVKISSKVTYKDMQKALRSIKVNDIIFIDEIHQLSNDIVEALLYPAMEDYEMNISESVNGRISPKTIKLPPFTLIGATTETGRLLKPFYSKFPLNVTLQEYDLDVIVAIIKNSFASVHIAISDDLAYDIAKRSRRLPRTANAYVTGIGGRTITRLSEKYNIPDGALKNEEEIKRLNAEVSKEDVAEYFESIQVDELGLKEDERKILKIIIEKYNGGPVGLLSLTKALNMTDNRVDQEYEPYLVKLGFINIRPQGRYATEAAYRYMGYSRGGEQIPEDGANEGGGYFDATTDDYSAKSPFESSETGYGEAMSDSIDSTGNGVSDEADDLPVIEGKAGEFDAKAAEWISTLFSGDGEINRAPLDDIFLGANKSYDSIAKNRCILRVNGNDLYCDSILERKFLSLLFTKGYIMDARSEALELEYSSARMSGKTYYPDFVLKLHDGTVAILEMKNLTSMGYHLNIAKYNALKQYCINHGFRYAEVAKDGNRYVSAEQLIAEPVNEKLRAFVKSKIDEFGDCNLNDLKEFGYNERELTVLLLNDGTLKNKDRTGGNPLLSAEN